MAKKEKEAKASKKDKVEDKVEKTEFKYGVADIAEKLGIKDASVRVQLRNKGIEKAGKSYGWNSKAELQEVIDQLKSGGADEDDKPAKKSKKDKGGDEKPAKSKKDKKAGKDKPAKKSKKDEDDEDDD